MNDMENSWSDFGDDEAAPSVPPGTNILQGVQRTCRDNNQDGSLQYESSNAPFP